MPVFYENAFSAAGNSTAPAASTTVGAVSNRLLLVALKAMNGPLVTSPNFGGTGLTSLITFQEINVYYLIAPAVTTANVAATLGTAQDWVIASEVFSGVDQSTPFGTVTTVTNTEQTSITQSAIATADGLVTDVAFMVIDAMTVDAAQTRRVSRDSFNGGFVSFGMSTKPGSAGSVNMTWNAANTFGDNSLIVIPLIAAAGGGGQGSAPISWLRAA